MNIRNLKITLAAGIMLTSMLIVGCESTQQGIDPNSLAMDTDLGVSIGSLAEVFSVNQVAVEGYGLVLGLNGTGSSECPPAIRNYLEQTIKQQLPKNEKVGPYIDSRDSAVVLVRGMMPTSIADDPYFDVSITPLPNTQTTSLKGGWLFTTDLKAAGRFDTTLKNLAGAEGAVYIDTIDPGQKDEKAGYVLAGGTAKAEYKITVSLKTSDHRIAGAIRNKLNQRYSEATTKALSPGQLEVVMPARYRGRKQRFIDLIKATYINETSEKTQKRISSFIKKLATSENKYSSEIALEAIGNKCFSKLTVLLKSSNEEVRLRAARVMLNLNSDLALDVLREIASDKQAKYRQGALLAITVGARRNDAASIARKLLRDEDFNIRLAAYEQLRKLQDVSVWQSLVGEKFYLEQVPQTAYKDIFVSRSGQPRIVLFASELRSQGDIFVQSEDKQITINAPLGQEYVSIIRNHPTRQGVIIQLKSSFELSDIIRALCEDPTKKPEQGQPGLGVSYAQMIALVKDMCDGGMVDAEFHAGPMPKVGRIFKRKPAIDR
jgi:flagellar basal body P-ring protein FlgI